ncbi:MAG: hypothetical protein Q8P82_01030 [bacterium]|nr:hypothetical protein [bacterium]
MREQSSIEVPGQESQIELKQKTQDDELPQGTEEEKKHYAKTIPTFREVFGSASRGYKKTPSVGSNFDRVISEEEAMSMKKREMFGRIEYWADGDLEIVVSTVVNPKRGEPISFIPKLQWIQRVKDAFRDAGYDVKPDDLLFTYELVKKVEVADLKSELEMAKELYQKAMVE